MVVGMGVIGLYVGKNVVFDFLFIMSALVDVLVLVKIEVDFLIIFEGKRCFFWCFSVLDLVVRGLY